MVRTGHTEYFLPKKEIKGYNVLMEETFLINLSEIAHMKILQKLPLVKEMIALLVVCYIIFISTKIKS